MLGTIKNLKSCQFEMITYLVYPTHKDIIFCRLKTNEDKFIWKLVKNPVELSKSISGYSFPNFKNRLNAWLHFVLVKQKDKLEGRGLSSKRYPYLNYPIKPVISKDDLDVFNQFHSVVKEFHQLDSEESVQKTNKSRHNLHSQVQKLINKSRKHTKERCQVYHF